MAKKGLPRFLVEQLCQGISSLPLPAQGIEDQSTEIFGSEGRQYNFLRLCSRIADRSKGPHQWVRGTDFVVAVGSNQQHVPHVRIGDQVLQQLQSCRIQPLQIVQEQRQRMLRLSEGA